MKNKEMDWYYQGMQKAYQIMKTDGPEALETEMKFRGLTGIQTKLSAKEINMGMEDIKRITVETVLTMSLGVLYVEFGFGRKRLERFMNLFMDESEEINQDIVRWSEICDNIERLTGIRVSLKDDLREGM